MNSDPKAWIGDFDSWGKDHYRKIPISKWVQLARDRHIRDLKRQLSDGFPYWFDMDEADRAVWFFNTQLRHSKGKWAGQPFKLAAWQEWDIIRPLFGWKRLDGTRRFRKALKMLARKNGKSTLIAGILLYLAFADCEAGAEVVCAATKEQQAKIVWNECRSMVRKSPLLSEVCRLLAREIRCEELESTLQFLGRDSKTEDGWNLHGIGVDEYHAHKDDSMLNVLESATGARDNWLSIIISTAGFNSGSPCRDEQLHGQKILQGVIEDERRFVYICTADDPENWQDEAEWYKANPQLGDTISIEDFREAAKEAFEQKSKRNNFLVKRLNVWVQGHSPWMDVIKWDKCSEPFDPAILKGLPAFGALDLGRTQDLAALALAFLHPELKSDKGEPLIFLLMRYWLPAEQDLFQKQADDEAPYIQWIEEGFVHTTPGPVTRTDVIRNEIGSLAELYSIKEIAIDAWSTADLAQNLADDGIQVVKHQQSMKAMTFPINSLESLVVSQRLRHNGDPVLRLHVANAVAVYDGNENVKLMKNHSRGRIDGAVAAAMAVGRLLIQPEPEEFLYATRGIYVG